MPYSMSVAGTRMSACSGKKSNQENAVERKQRRLVVYSITKREWCEFAFVQLSKNERVICKINEREKVNEVKDISFILFCFVLFF